MVGTRPRVPANACSNQTKLRTRKKICKRMVGTPPRSGERLLQPNQTQNDKKFCKRMVGTRPRVPANACSNKTKLRTTKRFASAW